METAEFRRILGHWASGVSVVTTRTADGRVWGLTASAIASLSLEPALVIVCIERSADTHAPIKDAQVFAINVLEAEHERIARRFAASEISAKFDGLAHRIEQTGAPILEDALAWVDCRVHAQYDGGDHTIFVGSVLAGDARAGVPLLYYRGGYGRFTP